MLTQLSLSLLLSSMALAYGKPVCTLESVSRNCDFFREHESEAEIKLPDGTSYQNPLFKAKTPAPAGISGSPGSPYSDGNPPPNMGGMYFGPQMTPEQTAKMAKMQEDAIVSQSQVLELMEDSKLSLKSKMALSQQGPFLLTGNALSLPFPLSDKNSRFQMVPSAKVLEELKAALGQEKYSQVVNIWKQKNAQMMADFQASQQAAMKAIEAQRAKLQEAEQANTLKNQARAKRIQELFEFAKQQVKNAIKNGVDESNLDPVKTKMIQKIEAIKLTDLNDVNLAMHPTCGGSGNAFYNPKGNTVNLCPDLKNRPDAALVATFGHEIGHSVDPCRFQLESWEISQNKLHDFIKEGHVNAVDRETLEQYEKEKVSRLDYNLDFILSDVDLSARLEKAGVFKKLSGSTEFSKYPFLKEYNCQIKEHSFKDTSQKDIEITNDYLRSILGPGEKIPLLQRSMKQFKALSLKYPQCFDSATHNSQMGEVMGDAFGAYALEAYVREYPLKTEAERTGALRQSSQSCGPSGPSSRGADIIPPDAIQSILQQSRDEHPAERARAEKVFLSRPALAALYNCTPAHKNCFLGLPSQQAKDVPKMSDKGVQ
jgi:hypothetical protein